MPHEYFCSFVGRDLSRCDAHLRIDNRNDYQAPVSARALGWGVSFGTSTCPEHTTQSGPKVKK